MDYVITALIVLFATVLLAVEIMLIPGFGFTGILGVLSMIGAISYSFFVLGNVAGWITLLVACAICVGLFLWALYGKSLDKVALKKNIDSTVKEDEINVYQGEVVQILASNQQNMFLVFRAATDQCPAAEGWIPGFVLGHTSAVIVENPDGTLK